MHIIRLFFFLTTKLNFNLLLDSPEFKKERGEERPIPDPTVAFFSGAPTDTLSEAPKVAGRACWEDVMGLENNPLAVLVGFIVKTLESTFAGPDVVVPGIPPGKVRDFFIIRGLLFIDY